MKKSTFLNIIIGISICTVLSYLIVSCDKISENDYLKNTGVTDTSTCPIPTFQVLSENQKTIKKVLLEDYTGHTCGNCPAAADTAKILSELYPEKVITMGVHIGFFATPQPPEYPTDFTCQTSEELEGKFRVSAAGNPNGMINRKFYDPNNLKSKNHILLPKNWRKNLETSLNEPNIACLQMENFKSQKQDLYCLYVKTTKINSNLSKANLVIYLTEDSIVADQKDYKKSPDHISNYIHRHVLRGTVNSTFGTNIINDSDLTLALNDSRIKGFNFKLSNNWNAKHINLVAVLYNPETYEVIQVEEQHLNSK